MSDHGAASFASPAPAGLTALAIACFTFFAVLTGQVGHNVTPLLACWLIGGFVVQLGCGLIELKDGHLLGGNVFFFFSAFFMLTGGLEFFVRASATYAAAKPDAAIDGWAWLVLFITLVLWTPCYMKTSTTIMGWLVIILTVGVFFVVARDLGWMTAAQASPLAGWCLLITGCLGIYQAAAIELNAAFGRVILPVGGPMIK